MNRKTVKLWVGVNRNGKISMHTQEPKRNEILGIWESSSPFVNFVVYENLSKMFSKTPINFNCPCEIIEINL